MTDWKYNKDDKAMREACFKIIDAAERVARRTERIFHSVEFLA